MSQWSLVQSPAQKENMSGTHFCMRVRDHINCPGYREPPSRPSPGSPEDPSAASCFTRTRRSLNTGPRPAQIQDGPAHLDPTNSAFLPGSSRVPEKETHTGEQRNRKTSKIKIKWKRAGQSGQAIQWEGGAALLRKLPKEIWWRRRLDRTQAGGAGRTRQAAGAGPGQGLISSKGSTDRAQGSPACSG